MSPAVLRLRVPADTASLAGYVRRVRAFLADHNIDHALAHDIPLCVHECCANAIVHSGSAADIDVRVTVDEEAVTVLCADSGRGPDPGHCDPQRPPGLRHSNGRGLYLMAHLMDEFEIGVDHGTTVRMSKRLNGPPT